MNVSTIILVAALVASVFLVTETRARPLAIAATVVAGVALALAMGLVSIHVANLGVGLSVALLAIGVFLVMRVHERLRVVAATVVAAVGALGTLAAVL